jgi:hypothetical protein
MQAQGCGRYCQLCERVVIDFTSKTSIEVKDYLRKNPDTCGRFYPYQLIPPPGVPKRNIASTYLMLISAFFSSAGPCAFARSLPAEYAFVKSMKLAKDDTGSKAEYIKGHIEGEDGMPVSGAKVRLLHHHGKRFRGITDSAGNFVIALPKKKKSDLAVVVKYDVFEAVGYIDQQADVNKEHKIVLKQVRQGHAVMGAVRYL